MNLNAALYERLVAEAIAVQFGWSIESDRGEQDLPSGDWRYGRLHEKPTRRMRGHANL